MRNQQKTYLLFVSLLICTGIGAQEHPNLILTKSGVESIRKNLGTTSLFDSSLKTVQNAIDKEIASGIDVPIPKDYSGGYTHERHKRNFLAMQKAGVLFQILNDEKYAVYVRDMLFSYESLYKTLPLHPKERSYARGKLFWQCLNDSNWLVYTSQAYDCIYEFLSKKEREMLEKNLFQPFADFISVENPQFFNRVHNHSTWGNAAVGMIGLVMGDDELVDRALYGIKDANLKLYAKDNDGGFIKTEGKAGFLANLDEPFSPDGYYTEGPYYQRYAMYPFLIFAVGLHNARPELKIFEYKDSVLLKSVKTLINLSDKDGEFFPINDAQKGMSIFSRELTTAVDIAYHYGIKDPELLDIAQKQNRVLLDDSGMAVAKAISQGRAKPFLKKSVAYSDGPKGEKGGISVLRQQDLELVFKYTAQGLSHGHYDKLSFMLYEDGHEVIQDYGMARFVNIEQKGGGNYLKENKTWAKQSIAHNTLVVNETSHFDGKYELGSKYHSQRFFSKTSDDKVQVVSAKEGSAYPGVVMHRTVAMIQSKEFDKPMLLDVFKVNANKKNTYDFPIHFMGQVIQTNFEYAAPGTLETLGTKNGYQHLYLEASGISKKGNGKLTWMRNNQFYTWTSTTKEGDVFLFTRLGANDPEFNLRRDAGLILRRKESQNTLFVSVIEAHGEYSPVTELSSNSTSSILELAIELDTDMYTAISVKHKNGKRAILLLSNQDPSPETLHKQKINTKEHQWKGPCHFVDFKS